MIGDVGQEHFEEVDYETLARANGAYFGWDEYEGFAPFECDGRCARRRERPIFVYNHSKGCSIIGGYVVGDRRLRSLYKRYVFTDLCAGAIRSFVPRLGGCAAPSARDCGSTRRSLRRGRGGGSTSSHLTETSSAPPAG